MSKDSTTHTMIGRVLAKDFKIISFLGKGGMGSVFVAYQRSLKRKVAIKILPATHLLEEELQRFEREIVAMSKLAHSNIVSIFHRGRYGDPPNLYYAMELMEGGALKDYLARHRALSPAVAVRLIRPVAEALAFAHGQGFVHRDIKPGNLLLHRNCKILKIADFGIAKQESEPTITHTQAMLGTFFYAAPEQMQWFEDAQGNCTEPVKVDARADQYSLGVVLYEMLAGHLPYPGNDFLSFMRSMVNPPLPLDLDDWGQVGKDLAWVVSKMISRSPEKRFSTDEEVVEALSAIEAQTSTLASTRIHTQRLQEDKLRPRFTKGRLPKQSRPARARSGSGTPHHLPLLTVALFLVVVTILIYTVVAIKRHLEAERQKLQNEQSQLHDLVTKLINDKDHHNTSTHGTVVPVVTAVTLQIAIQYDIAPSKEQVPLVELCCSDKRITITKSARVLPGRYTLQVRLAGYTCRENAQTVVVPVTEAPFLLQLHLQARKRKINPWVLDQKDHQKVVPLVFKLAGKTVKDLGAIKPGSYPVQLKFQRYAAVAQRVQVPPGEGAFTIILPLQPLFRLAVPLPTRHELTIDGINYALEIMVDGQPVPKEHINRQQRDGRTWMELFLPQAPQVLCLYCGYYSIQRSAKRFDNIVDWERIVVERLIQHCRQTPNTQLRRLQELFATEMDKLRKIPSEQRRRLEQYLQTQAQSVTQSQRQRITPLILQLKRLDPQEWHRYQVSQAIKQAAYQEQRLPLERKKQVWQKLAQQYPTGPYADLIRKRLAYWQRLHQYEQTIRQAVSDGYISLQEKRRIRKLEQGLRPTHIAMVHRKLAAYVQTLNCGQTLDELLK